MWLGVRLFIVENHLAMISIFICFNLCLYSAACRRKDFPKQVLECFTSHTSLDRCRAERASRSMFHENISDHRHHQCCSLAVVFYVCLCCCCCCCCCCCFCCCCFDLFFLSYFFICHDLPGSRSMMNLFCWHSNIFLFFFSHLIYP